MATFRSHITFFSFGLFFLFCQFIFLSHYWLVGNGVWGDGRFYYVIVRSAVIDHDLDFHNESQVNPFTFEQISTPTGKVFNKYSIGAPLLWSPFFLVADGMVHLGQTLHLTSLPADGYSHPYRLAIGMGAVTYACLGIYFTYLGLKESFSSQLALLSSLGVALGTNVFFYTAVDPVNSHSASIFAAGLFFYLLTKYWQKPQLLTSLFLGVVCGLLALIRMQDILFLFAVYWLIWQQSHLSLLQKVTHWCAVSVMTLITFIPQLAEWQYLLGSIRNPYSLIGETFMPLQPHFLEVLFSFNNGLFVWSPLLIASLVGLVITRKSIFSQLGLGLWLLEAYAISSWHGWWGGASFGGRMFLALAPFFAFGLAKVLERFKIEKSLKLSFVFLLTLGIANLGAIVLFLLAN